MIHFGIMIAKEKKQILIRVKPDTRKILRRAAAERDTSLQTIVEELIEASLSQAKNSGIIALTNQNSEFKIRNPKNGE